MAVSALGRDSGFSGHVSQLGRRDALTPEQQQEVNRLKAIDRQVRAHEQAHMAAGAGVTGGASLQFTRGPDGRQYAVAGEVTINVSSGQTPEATLERARRIQAAALAPVDPSPQDRAVAAQAAMLEAQARLEMSQQRQEAQEEGSSETSADPRRQAAGLRAYAAQNAEPSSARLDLFV